MAKMLFAVFHSAAARFSTTGRFVSRSWSLSTGEILSPSRSTGNRGRRGAPFSTLSSSSPSVNIKWDDKDYPSTQRRRRQQQQQVRLYHATSPRQIILPFVPEMIVFVIVAGGWTVYRTANGKPLTPDEALKAQEAYRKHEEKLRQQRWQQEPQEKHDDCSRLDSR